MKRRLIGSLLLASLAMILLPRLSAPLADWYAGAVFARLPALNTRLPVAELLLLASAGYALIRLLLLLLRPRARLLARYFENAVLLLSALLLTYGALWAPLYAATPISASMPFYSARMDERELSALCLSLAERAEAVDAHRQAGTFALPYDEAAMLRLAGEAIAQVTGRAVSAPKALRYPELFDALGIAGMYVPWTRESLINPNDVPVALPFTACHEAAHQAGYAREEEANYIAWLACLAGDDSFQYAGYLNILKYSMDLLRASDEALWSACASSMGAGVRADFAALGGFTTARPTRARALQSGATAAFLRANGQVGGLDQYTAVVPLVYAAWKSPR